MTLTVVAFDLSLTSTGVADRNGTRRIQPKSTGDERLAEVRDAVVRASHITQLGSGPLCYECQSRESEMWSGRRAVTPPIYGAHPDLVVIEGYSYASGNQAHQVGELGGVVRLALHEAGIRYEVVSPATIKAYGTGRGNASKDEMLLAAVRRFGYEGSSHDEADALILWHLAMHALGETVVSVPQSHLRALKALPWAVATVGAV